MLKTKQTFAFVFVHERERWSKREIESVCVCVRERDRENEKIEKSIKKEKSHKVEERNEKNRKLKKKRKKLKPKCYQLDNLLLWGLFFMALKFKGNMRLRTFKWYIAKLCLPLGSYSGFEIIPDVDTYPRLNRIQ